MVALEMVGRIELTVGERAAEASFGIGESIGKEFGWGTGKGPRS
jgi:hypothetical protein